VLNAPGSWHDEKIAQPLYDKLLQLFNAGIIANRIQAPMKAGQQLPRDSQHRTSSLGGIINYSHTVRRQSGGCGNFELALAILKCLWTLMILLGAVTSSKYMFIHQIFGQRWRE
ncbi:hypothetical protein C8Q70DRAFT_925218, partial [Cubamyces menziesii]